MKRTEFDYQIFAMVKINGKELSRLLELSKIHYDGRCRAAGEIGGFLYGFVQQWIISGELEYKILAHYSSSEKSREEIMRISTHELDTLAKICEQDGSSWSFISILKECGAEYKRLVDHSEPDEGENNL